MVQKKTSRGAIIDFDAMVRAGENERAIGNMPVNAKGDVMEGKGVVKSNEERVREYYETTKTVTQEKASLKGDAPELSGEVSKVAQPKTADTQKENIRTQEAQEQAKKNLTPDPVSEPEPEAPLGESFDEEEPLGFKEVELPNGDIEMVPYYTEEDAPNETKST